MKFAVHYSPQTLDLIHQQKVTIDCFKCPAWPDLLETIPTEFETYVHFPLVVGKGIRAAYDKEAKQVADWHKVERLLEQTNTPYINLHLSPSANDYPGIKLNSTKADDYEQVLENTYQDMQEVVQRFGADRIILENDHDNGKLHLRLAIQPEFINTLVKSTRCGFLFDLSHARLAAHYLEMEVADYIDSLPTDSIREIHMTGLQRFDTYWIDLLRDAGIEESVIGLFSGRLMDHLPMTDEDWDFFDWSLQQIQQGHWAAPWVIAYEYSGVGALWQALTKTNILGKELPRFYTLIHALAMC